MSTLFISHSSEDRELAGELAGRLWQQGHHSLFLDFDPAQGIPAGQSWERTLYRKLRAAKAVIALCTDRFLASQWCFAEVALARMEGKLVFALQADPLSLPMPAILADKQFIDLRADPEEGYLRLWRGLEEAELLRATGDWDPGQSPYLGLNAYQEEHAPIFFGREEETRAGLELLSRGAPGLIVVVGASGSGKSSLVRAGIVPRLRTEESRWLVVEPFRPGRDPFVELADSLLTEFRRYDPRRAERLGRADYLARKLAAGLPSVAAAGPDTSPTTVLVELALDLRRAAHRRDARVLLVVDQLEEALGRDRAQERCDRFLALLRASVEPQDSPLMVVATVPSDYLEPFQRNAALRGIDFETLPLGPMKIDGMRRVIEEPARLAAIELEPGLADRLIADTESPDALPLLSFTLWVLWRDYRQDGRLEVSEYERLGGLHGAVTAEADALLARATREGKRDALQRAFLRLAKLGPEGRYARRPAPWDAEELTAVEEVLKRFVERRLLVRRAEGDAPMVEVAHEALFRSWAPLMGWLDSNRTEMLLRQQIERDSELWLKSGRSRVHLWSGGRLQQAGELLGKGGLEPEERRFVRAGLRHRRVRRWALAGVTVSVVASLTGFLLWALREKEQAETARETAQNLARAGIGSTLVEADPTQANLLLLEVEEPETMPFVMAALHEALAAPLKTALYSSSEFEIAQSFNHDGTLLLSLGWADAMPDRAPAPAPGEGWTVTVWDAVSGRPHRLLGEAPTGSMAEFSPVRDHVLALAGPDTLQVTDIATGEVLFRKTLRGVWLADYAEDGGRIAALCRGGEVRILDALSGEEVSSFPLSFDNVEVNEDLEGLALIPRAYVPFQFDGERLAARTGPDAVSVWAAGTAQRLSAIGDPSERILAFSLRSNYLLTAGDSGTARLRDLVTGRLIVELDLPFGGDKGFASFSPDGGRIAVALPSGRLLVLDVGESYPRDRPWRPPSIALEDPRPAEEREADYTLAFTSDGRRVVGSGLWEGRGGVWDAATGRLLMSFGGSAMAVSADGGKVASFHKAVDLKGGGAYPTEILQLPANAELSRLPGEECSWCDEALQEATRPAQALVEAPGGRRFARETKRVVAETKLSAVELLDADRSLLRSVSGSRPKFSADGRYLLTQAGLTATVWDAATARRVSLLVGHTATVTDALFSPNGAWVVTGSIEDDTVRVWHTESGTPIAVVPRPGASVAGRGIAVKPDGTRLVMQAEQGRHTWALSGELLQALIRSRTNLCLEPEHRRKRLAESRDEAWRTFERCERCLGRCAAPAMREEWLGESPEAAAAAHQACVAGLEAEAPSQPGIGLEQSWRAWKSCFSGGS